MITFFQFGVFFCLGAIIGSFIAHMTKSLITETPPRFLGRSKCDGCHAIISYTGLIPILGFFIKKGVCPSCRHRVDRMYPFIELATALFFGITALLFGDIDFILSHSYQLVLLLAFVSIAVYTTATDMLIKAFSVIPLIGGTIIALLSSLFFAFPVGILESLTGLLIGLSSFACIALVGFFWKKQQVIGEGDFYLIAFLGSTLGTNNTLICLYIAILTGATIGSIQYLYKKESLLPFAPFLCAGWFISYFFGSDIIAMYLSFLV